MAHKTLSITNMIVTLTIACWTVKLHLEMSCKKGRNKPTVQLTTRTSYPTESVPNSSGLSTIDLYRSRASTLLLWSDCNWQFGWCLGRCWLDGKCFKTEESGVVFPVPEGHIWCGANNLLFRRSGGVLADSRGSSSKKRRIQLDCQISKDWQGYVFLFFPRAVQVHTQPLWLWATGPRLWD